MERNSQPLSQSPNFGDLMHDLIQGVQAECWLITKGGGTIPRRLMLFFQTHHT